MYRGRLRTRLAYSCASSQGSGIYRDRYRAAKETTTAQTARSRERACSKIRDAFTIDLPPAPLPKSVTASFTDHLAPFRLGVILPHALLFIQVADQVDFLELRMPRMSGLQFRHAQLNDPDLAAVPVIALSGTPGDASISAPRPVALFTKPPDFAALLKLVGALVLPTEDGPLSSRSTLALGAPH
jgi:CheY-like chemotaxis protein